MWNIITKLERKVLGTAETLKEAAQAMFEAKQAGFECDIVKEEVK